MLAPEVTLDSLLTPNELAARLKVSRFWIYEKLRRRDGFPHFRCGRYLRFSWPAVHAWLTAGSVERAPVKRALPPRANRRGK